MNGVPAGAEAPPPSEVVIRKYPKALSQRDPVKIAEHFWRSGFFDDVQSMSQAVVKVVAGEELGLGPFAAIKGITMIEGDLGFSANLVATKVMQHEHYRYVVKETANEKCVLEFWDGEELRGESEFTLEDAERAGLVKPKSNWEKWPKAMCFNRALTQGVRAYIPDVTAGVPAYTDDEIEEVVTPAPIEAEVIQEDGLPGERIVELLKGYEIAGPHLGGANELDGLNFLLGTLGADAISPGEGVEDRIIRALNGLTPEQADELGAEFKKAVEKAEANDAGA